MKPEIQGDAFVHVSVHEELRYNDAKYRNEYVDVTCISANLGSLVPEITATLGLMSRDEAQRRENAVRWSGAPVEEPAIRDRLRAMQSTIEALTHVCEELSRWVADPAVRERIAGVCEDARLALDDPPEAGP